MKYPLLALFSIVFFSCSNPLEKTYDKVGLAKDIIELKAIVSEDRLNELEGYISISTQLGVNIVGKTYNELLYDIETSKKNEINRQNDYTRVNINELLNQRLENHMCDEFILEMNKKETHNYNEKNNKTQWDDDSYFIDY
tara:strand:+ start:560 stop:979 length:420 start_codon:yes stop_codon:yes gene_type:complete